MNVNREPDGLSNRINILSSIGHFDLWFRTTTFELLRAQSGVTAGASHYHTMYDVHFASQGSFLVLLEHEKIRVEVGQILILPPNLRHRTDFDKESKDPCMRGNFKFSFVRKKYNLLS